MNKILLIDDEEIVRDMIGDILHHLGFHIIPAKNGTEALDLYKQALDSGHCFDSVFIDVISRDGVGERETMDLLFEMDPEAKIVISSTTIPHPILVKKERGQLAMVPKPFTVKNLKSTFENIFSTPGTG